MDDEINVLIRNADQTQKAEISLEPYALCRDILETAQQNWKLPEGEGYRLLNTTTGKELRLESSLAEEGIQEGDILQVQPILVAGNKR